MSLISCSLSLLHSGTIKVLTASWPFESSEPRIYLPAVQDYPSKLFVHFKMPRYAHFTHPVPFAFLTSAGNFGQRENAAYMLSLLLKNFSPLLKPYTTPIITTLISTLKATKVPSNIAHHCIYGILSCTCSFFTPPSAVGNLVVHTGRELRDFTKELIIIVRENFQDRKPSKKRAAALDTLGKLISCTCRIILLLTRTGTGYAVDPLETYPTLLDLLFEKIETATPHERSKLLRLLGIIGAVDPYRYKVCDAQDYR